MTVKGGAYFLSQGCSPPDRLRCFLAQRSAEQRGPRHTFFFSSALPLLGKVETGGAKAYTCCALRWECGGLEFCSK